MNLQKKTLYIKLQNIKLEKNSFFYTEKHNSYLK